MPFGFMSVLSSSMPSGQGHIGLTLVSQSQQPFNLITRLSLRKRLLSSCRGLRALKGTETKDAKHSFFLKEGEWEISSHYL